MTGYTSLTGRWLGRYDYSGNREGVGFEVDLVDIEGDLSGSIFEPNTFRRDMGSELTAELGGRHASGTVQFVKRYLGFRQGNDPAYSGEVNAALTRIAGTWVFPGRGGSGRFVMSRKPLAAARVERLESVTVD